MSSTPRHLKVETVRAPFKGHTEIIEGLALSSDDALIASTSKDSSIKLWAFESRQLLASFHVSTPHIVVFSPDTQQLAYTTYLYVYICNIPPNILASIELATKGHPKKIRATFEDLLHIPATSLCIPSTLLRRATTQGRSRVGPRENRTPAPPVVSSAQAPITFKTRLVNWWRVHTGHAPPPIVDVPLAQGKKCNTTVDAPKQQDEDVVLDEYFDDEPLLQNPNSQQSTAAAPMIAGHHGNGRFCFCF
ncbi:hypothetical protein K503DRAFT_785593 [Rhizopogon vinicolor AM-OR11-026]|uniref:Uncharacterized protein n=1 Tax=Rhizopogon vinicolor AM-OR11-026 TaxID=1314800 RepID=A0A1B7MPZ9_9AGAM|nr:hypothetical protein K503DRAFT_785593 [Rhizopogon vinicolor AM-OR11-026]